MRESVNFNMIPIPAEDNNNMNGLMYLNNNNVRNILTNVSSNGYYGYQSPVCLNVKQGYGCNDGKQRVQLQINNNENVKVEENMDVQYSNEASLEAKNVPKFISSRKRTWDYEKHMDFKRKRSNEPDPVNSSQVVCVPVHNLGSQHINKCFMGHYV